MHALAGVCRDTTQGHFRVIIIMNETPGDRSGTQTPLRRETPVGPAEG